ncbi:class I tRNA ligase family protein, partial [Candidatus Micrarchaeota archaeon]|nr:class I tRNA ligase family protein [Candidatus Micrarchaeota archaeon]MBU1886150.1 class I tRNA ligase family protein [Candidatus Micrarchaeota archaeon]
WCISRQRYWGIPLPIWKCECGKIKVIGSKDEIPEVKELHRPYIDEIELDCECGKKMNRIKDVLDVWFDSGNAVWASLSPDETKKYTEQTNLIIEGQDQIRGWFYSLLGSGVVRSGSCPYKCLLMHGFFVDEHGIKMSKSVGNFIPLEQILEKYGADSFRLWGLSNTVWDELKFSWDEMKKARTDLNIVFNMVVFLERFYPKKKIEKLDLQPVDKWLISRLNSTVKEFRHHFESYEFNKAVKALRYFIVEDLSRFYMKIAKERISKDEHADAALYTIYEVMLLSLKMLGCICPLLSEHLYQKFFRTYEKDESLFMLTLSHEEAGSINVLAEKQIEIVKDVVSTAFLVRQTAELKVRWPVRTLYVETKSHEAMDSVNAFSDIILRLVNAKELKTVEELPKGEVASGTFIKGSVHLDKKMDGELYEEGIINEVKRRVQIMRKEAQLIESDAITLSISSEKEIEAIIDKNQDKFKDGVNAGKIDHAVHKEMNEYNIDGRIVKIVLKKA